MSRKGNITKMWHIIQHLFNEVNELLGSSLFLGSVLSVKSVPTCAKLHEVWKTSQFLAAAKTLLPERVRESEGGLGNR